MSTFLWISSSSLLSWILRWSCWCFRKRLLEESTRLSSFTFSSRFIAANLSREGNVRWTVSICETATLKSVTSKKSGRCRETHLALCWASLLSSSCRILLRCSSPCSSNSCCLYQASNSACCLTASACSFWTSCLYRQTQEETFFVKCAESMKYSNRITNE